MACQKERDDAGGSVSTVTAQIIGAPPPRVIVPPAIVLADAEPPRRIPGYRTAERAPLVVARS
jgi:hypothetical protein